MNAIDFSKAIVLAIRQIDATNNIYCEKIPQGFTRPCFFVQVAQKQEALMQNRAKRTFAVKIIRYLSPNAQNALIAKEWNQKLALALEWIEVDTRWRRAGNVATAICLENNTLTFETTYTTHILFQQPFDKMQTLDSKMKFVRQH